MEGKKVRIVAVHKTDAYYSRNKRKSIIGLIGVMLNKEPSSRKTTAQAGYCAGDFYVEQDSIPDGNYWKTVGGHFYFARVKVEEVDA